MENKNKTVFFTALISELKDFLKNTKKLIPSCAGRDVGRSYGM